MESFYLEPKWLRLAPSDRVVGGGFSFFWGLSADGNKEASRTRDYCAAKSAAHRAARTGPSATIKLSLQDDKKSRKSEKGYRA